jgi:hypothetical protein
VDAGATLEKANAAAAVVVASKHVATKVDLEAMKNSLVMWFAGIVIAHWLAVVVATVALLKLLP